MTADSNDEFYVGYLPKAPPGIARRVRLMISVILFLTIVVPLLVALSQREFAASRFDFGELSEVRGVVSRNPVPMLKSTVGRDIHGNPLVQTFPLVAFGKIGAGSILESIQAGVERPLSEIEITLRGTLIYYDGKALLELTEGADALVESHGEASPALARVVVREIGPTVLRGEIVDSKCYFGVMKPAQGKPHRSCAIRCIAGGIPPVFMVRNAEGHAQYLLLLGEDGRPINQEVLPYVADPVELTGNLAEQDDWLLIRVDPARGIRRL